MLRIGVIGLGTMGQIHLANLSSRPDEVQVVAVFDPDKDTVDSVVGETGIRQCGDAAELIFAEDVDAVLIASPAVQHWDQITFCLKAGKYVFCEKPLVTDAASLSEIQSVMRTGAAQRIWVGFMRRRDLAFCGLKADVDSGAIGRVVFSEMSHRNPFVPDSFTDEDYMLETFIHECDVVQWMLSDSISLVQVDAVAQEKEGAQRHDPQFITMTTATGSIVRLTGHISNGYGYDIRCEVVGEKGSRNLDDSLWAGERAGAADSLVSGHWSERFAQAYRDVIFSWIDDVVEGKHTGAGLHDGLRASQVAWALIEAIKHPGIPVPVAH